MVRCPACACECTDTHSYCVACGTELAPASRSREDALVGVTLPGGYRVTHLLGVGGMGRVYRAEQVALGRTVAVKVVHPHLAHDDLAVGRFLTEARAASRLSHPNCVAIFDFGRTVDGHPYIVMEYLRGRDLARVVQSEGPLPLRRIVDVLRQTLAALDEAHALGVVHRDLKPDNIVLEPLRSGLDCVKVVDFGLAKLISGGEPVTAGGASVSRPGLVCGTPEYMSPEQALGDELDGRSDLYSVGTILFELLTGALPFEAHTLGGTLLLHLTQPAPDPREVAPDRAIPAPFAELVLRSLAKSRNDRLQSAGAFAEALENALLASDGRQVVVSAPTTAIRCASCGRLSPIGQKFCGECGISIPGKRASPALTSSVPAHRFQLPLLARDEVISWLEVRSREASSMPAAAHLVGETGMGKTRLIVEMLSRWSARGDRVVSVGPDPGWAKIGDYAVRAAIRKLAELPDTGVAAVEWASANHLARRGLGALFGPDGPPLAAAERRAALAEALRWALERAAERAGPARVVLAVDDLDFVDGTSRNAFADVLAEPPPVPALLMVAYMPRTRPVSDPVQGEAWRLAPLPYVSFAGRLPSRVAVWDVHLAPLHVEQLMAWSVETTEPPPDRLADLVARRIERLSPYARHLLHALAVWGDGASLETMRSILPTTVDATSALKALERARIASVGDEGICITHPLLRRVVFSTIPAGRKRELFARAAELRLDPEIEIRAKQAMHGGGALEALALLDALSVRRTAHGDMEGSVSALRHALDLARRELHRGELDDPNAAVLVFSRKLAEALAASYRWSDAEGVLREALGNAPPTSEHRAHLLGVLAHVANSRRHPGEARRYLDEAMRVARQSDARGLLPMLEELDKAIEVA
jgi:serine/threonine protein kinase